MAFATLFEMTYTLNTHGQNNIVGFGPFSVASYYNLT